MLNIVKPIYPIPRYAVAEEAGLGDTGHQAVRRRQRKVARPRLAVIGWERVT